MSRYIEDNQGRIVSEPVNETNTKYGYITPNEDGIRNADNYYIDTQYMYNNQPVSDIDTNAYAVYRDTVEELRHKTEKKIEAIQSCLIPVEINGMSFQPYEFRKSDQEYAQEIQDKIVSFTYFFQDHMSLISTTSKEFVFRTNKVKFITDRNRRLNYDREVHLLTLKEDEENHIPFRDVIYRTFFTYENGAYITRVKDTNAVDISYDNIIQAIYDDIINNNLKVTVFDGGLERDFADISDFDLVFKSGQDINTLVPSTLFNLHNMGWVDPCVIFLNGLIIPWTKVLISVDNIDTFVIVTNLGDEVSDLLEEQDIQLDYVHIPFGVEYIPGSITSNTGYYGRYVTNGKLNKSLIFIIDKPSASVKFQSMTQSIDYSIADLDNLSIDRIICLDDYIKYGEFELGTDDPTAKDVNVEYSKSFKEFCNNDYRCKLKRFNFLGFEFDRYWSDDEQNRGTYKNDDFDTVWHPFNIIDIHFSLMRHGRRIVKVFYNTKVLYDQDNVLRIKNIDPISIEYENYRKNIVGNMTNYLNEVYAIAKYDIGTYIATEGKLKGYRLNYITPYECYMICNAYQLIHEGTTLSFEEFLELNFLESETVKLSYINGGFLVTEPDDNRFINKMLVPVDIFIDDTMGAPREDMKPFFTERMDWEITEILVPLDNEIKTNPSDISPTSNVFESFEGDTRGKAMPYVRSYNEYVMEPDNTYRYDQLKLRFEVIKEDNKLDEFVYYFDNEGWSSDETYPVSTTSSLNNRQSVNTLYGVARNIFKSDSAIILPMIEKMLYSGDYKIPASLPVNMYKADFIITADRDDYTDIQGYTYKQDPHYYYNYGEFEGDIPVRHVSNYALRRNMTSTYNAILSATNYSITSMELLESMFDFTYDMSKSYDENLKSGVNYILGYDTEKLEGAIKRSVLSITKTGRELRTFMANHPAKKDITIDGFKMITFIKNHEQKLIFDNIIITLTKNATDITGITYHEYPDGPEIPFNVVNMKHRSQEQYTISKTMSTVTDIDHHFIQSFTSMRYNDTTELLEYYNGDELVITMQVDHVVDTSKLQMSRWNISSQDNYVMIFKNRILYDAYKDIEYTKTTFTVPYNGVDTDDFEFIFFLNANNAIIKQEVHTLDDIKQIIPDEYDDNGENITEMVTLDSAIPCNTSILHPENIQLLVDVMPEAEGEPCDPEGTDNTTYEITYTIKSYEGTVLTDTNSRKMHYKLLDDTKVNGLHRITKQGGGEYFLIFNGDVPENDDPEYGGYDTDRHIDIPYNLYLSSRRQFRYKHYEVEEDKEVGYIFTFNTPEYDEDIPDSYVYRTGIDDFKFCLDQDHIMVFRNGLLLPKTLYLLHSIVNTPINDTGIVFNVPLTQGDTVDIFYVTNDLKHIETEYYDTETNERYIINGLVKISSNLHDEYRVMGEGVNDLVIEDVEEIEPEIEELEETQVLMNDVELPKWRTNYIKFHSPIYGFTNKESLFVFLNGKKIRSDELRNISNSILSIDTDNRNTTDINAVRLEVMSHLDTQDIIERLYINDALSHTADISGQYADLDEGSPNVYESTLRISSFDMSDLENYTKQSELDRLINDSEINKLFYNYLNGTGPLTICDEDEMADSGFITREDVYAYIFKKYWPDFDIEDFKNYTVLYSEGNTIIFRSADELHFIQCEFDGMIEMDIENMTGNDLLMLIRDGEIRVTLTELDQFNMDDDIIVI